EDAYDGVSGKPCLVRQKRNHHESAFQVVRSALPTVNAAFKVAAPAVKDWNKGRHGNRHTQHDAPHRGSTGEEHSKYEQKQRGHRNKTPAQVIEDAPAVQNSQRIASNVPIAGPDAPQRPGRDLPVSTDPSMLSLCKRRVVEWKVLEQFNVGRESDAHVSPFDQVVTEQCLLGKPSVKNLMKGLNIVYRFSVKHGFAQQILLGIGD